jgi:DNA ligase (NAD+)
MTPEQRIDELVTRLNEANEHYRLGESSGMTDREFDKQLKELHELEKRHPEFVREDSPTRRIGLEPLTGLTRVRHSVPMLSIENAYTYPEIEKFLDQTDAVYYTLEHKVDGVALSLVYENGRLVQALTRGDGIEGDDVTHNAKTIPGIPHELKPVDQYSWSPPERFEIRGEVSMSKSAFVSWNAATGGHYKNPRNATAGAIRLLNPAECAKRPLRFIAYSTVTQDDVIAYQNQFLEICRLLGFATATGSACERHDTQAGCL